MKALLIGEGGDSQGGHLFKKRKKIPLSSAGFVHEERKKRKILTREGEVGTSGKKENDFVRKKKKGAS